MYSYEGMLTDLVALVYISSSILIDFIHSKKLYSIKNFQTRLDTHAHTHTHNFPNKSSFKIWFENNCCITWLTTVTVNNFTRGKDLSMNNLTILSLRQPKYFLRFYDNFTPHICTHIYTPGSSRITFSTHRMHMQVNTRLGSRRYHILVKKFHTLNYF